MCDYKALEGDHLSTVAEELLVSAVHLSAFASKFEKNALRELINKTTWQ